MCVPRLLPVFTLWRHRCATLFMDTTMHPLLTKDDIRTELETARTEFHALTQSLTAADLKRQSKNPGWTNAEVLFHITFAYMLLPSLLWLVRLFGRLPKAWSKSFAALLNRSTPPFNWINARAPHGGARIYYGERLERKYDRTHAHILRLLDRLPEPELRRGMYYPNQWDGLFHPYMTLAEVLVYPTLHFRFHRDQLDVPMPMRKKEGVA